MSAGRRTRAVRIHIDELRLEGFDPRHRYRIADALQRELARLVTERESNDETHASPQASERIDAGAISIREGAAPEQVGVAIARATFDAMHAPRGGNADRGGGP